ncbi:MAG: hypothetical protein JW395_1496 [Nitrospira sp.]|nr:hypothetical protein [Nitrospira sp.]
MTLLIGESPYYRSDCTRLLFTLIIELFKQGKAHCTTPVRLDIVEFPWNVNGKSWFDTVSDQPIL